jgi:hypothetical protein
MEKLVWTHWIQDLSYDLPNSGKFTVEELERVVRILKSNKLSYVEFDEDGGIDFYKVEEETDEEFEKRIQEKEGTLEFIEKLDYHKALETVERLKHKFEK